MITPEQIRKKATRRYRDCLRAWLTDDDSLFPLIIRFRHAAARDEMTRVMRAVQDLREQSKESLGYGYRIEWREIRTRRLGRNQFPDRIVFDTCEELMRYIDREEAFRNYQNTVRAIRERFPQLEPWLRSYVNATCEMAEQGIVHGLLDVCEYLCEHPRCGLFARELPVSVDTKFVERHRQVYFRPWLDILLPPGAIEATESHFERRFGLGYAEPMVQFRLLDAGLLDLFGAPAEHYGLPLSAAAALDLAPARALRFIVVENQVNFLTLPRCTGVVALLGLGYAANLFRYLKWLHHRPILYWGDIDVQGFEILSQFRTWFPQTESVFMDRQTLDGFVAYHVSGRPRQSARPLNLNEMEAALFEHCQARCLRLEQEKIPQSYIDPILQARLQMSDEGTA